MDISRNVSGDAVVQSDNSANPVQRALALNAILTSTHNSELKQNGPSHNISC